MARNMVNPFGPPGEKERAKRAILLGEYPEGVPPRGESRRAVVVYVVVLLEDISTQRLVSIPL
jgi:hypothetical protein